MARTLIFLIIAFLNPLSFNAFCQNNGPAGSLTVELAQRIVNDIYFLVWGATGTPPKVVFQQKTEGGVAIYYGGDNNQIRVSEKALSQLENQYGDRAADALAIILGHEMHHARTNSPGLKYGFVGKGSEHFKEERNADYFGLFYAYAAGYEGCLDLYDSIFETLDIKDGEGYPAVSERRKMNESVLEDAGRLIGKFEMANWLLLLGDQKPCAFALGLFEEVEKSLTGFKQIHYSKGLAALSIGLEYANAVEIYPVEVQSPDFLYLRSPGRNPYDENLAKIYFKKAKESFLKATGLDENFFEARLGYACALVAEKNFGEAKQSLASLNDCGGLGLLEKERIKLVEAILDFKKGNKSSLEEMQKSKWPLMAQMASLTLGDRPGKATPCVPLNLPELSDVSNAIAENQWLLQKMGNTDFYSNSPPRSHITSYRNGNYFYVFQESKDFNPPVESLKTDAQLTTGAGRWQLLQCGEEEALVRLDGKGEMRRCVKVVRNFKD